MKSRKVRGLRLGVGLVQLRFAIVCISPNSLSLVLGITAEILSFKVVTKYETGVVKKNAYSRILVVSDLNSCVK